jgi:hypothetical protein
MAMHYGEAQVEGKGGLHADAVVVRSWAELASVTESVNEIHIVDPTLAEQVAPIVRLGVSPVTAAQALLAEAPDDPIRRVLTEGEAITGAEREAILEAWKASLEDISSAPSRQMELVKYHSPAWSFALGAVAVLAIWILVSLSGSQQLVHDVLTKLSWQLVVLICGLATIISIGILVWRAINTGYDVETKWSMTKHAKAELVLRRFPAQRQANMRPRTGASTIAKSVNPKKRRGG